MPHSLTVSNKTINAGVGGSGYVVSPCVFGSVGVFGEVRFSTAFLVLVGVQGVSPETNDVSRGVLVVCEGEAVERL